MDVAKLLAKPREGITLDELKVELNALGKFRNDARLAFCLRLALVYLHIVGHKPVAGGTADPNVRKFYRWCHANLRSGTGKPYSEETLRKYWRVGFAENPLLTHAAHKAAVVDRHERERAALRTVAAIDAAVERKEPAAPMRLHTLRREPELLGPVAAQVSALVSAWDAACPLARRKFLEIVT